MACYIIYLYKIVTSILYNILYVLFKEKLGTEDYIKLCSSRRKRSLLAQFIMGILPIALETGRFRNLAIADRLCVLCNLKAVEDELHFLCVCSLYNVIRRDMFENLLHLNFYPQPS